MSRIKELTARLSQWWNSNARSGNLRREATARAQKRAQKAAGRVQDFRESERGQRAASKLNDLRSSGTAKRAEAAFNDLRQRESVKKAEESARKAMHDIFSGGPGKSGTTGTTTS